MVTQHNTDHNIVKVNTLDSGTLPGLDAAESLNPQPSFSDESVTALTASYTGSNQEDYKAQTRRYVEKVSQIVEAEINVCLIVDVNVTTK